MNYRFELFRRRKYGYSELMFRNAIDLAKIGNRVLWVCSEGMQAEWAKRFEAAGCRTDIKEQGIVITHNENYDLEFLKRCGISWGCEKFLRAACKCG